MRRWGSSTSLFRKPRLVPLAQRAAVERAAVGSADGAEQAEKDIVRGRPAAMAPGRRMGADPELQAAVAPPPGAGTAANGSG